ncbi:hypothetical protein [Streptomyces sp. NBC_01408]|uniref:hypothetical protein n=1 Tax=Streptomyces sp. NBC_01408 TaxID=2903855 RepID=UPI0022504795|nr:hypothetical protein [Streptomyces sp. NBC_01408]MCX4695638.1 hypothetical protein [Streptomyces sp. NBC_01408]
MEDVIRNAGQDWDRRTHRIRVLAEAAGRGLPLTWRRRSHTQDALVLHAWSDLVHARRTGSPSDLSAAEATCRHAAELGPADPVPWIVLLSILRLRGGPEAELASAWREAGARDPWNREAHVQLLGYLSPGECGSVARMLDFVDGVRATAPDTSPVGGLELAALIDRYHWNTARGGLDALTARHLLSRPPAARALGRAAELWPRPGHLTHSAALADLNLLAYALVQARRLEEAAITFATLDGSATPHPWATGGDPLEQFTYWHNRLLG